MHIVDAYFCRGDEKGRRERRWSLEMVDQLFDLGLQNKNHRVVHGGTCSDA